VLPVDGGQRRMSSAAGQQRSNWCRCSNIPSKHAGFGFRPYGDAIRAALDDPDESVRVTAEHALLEDTPS
jgi:hypothetical protein